ncbi:MAG TPA: serine hydrolase domain-containing protein [Gemmatimonadales bacterium]|nr:serine hydrolase domain-containing protein [Gemmatimonadales bacterium]
MQALLHSSAFVLATLAAAPAAGPTGILAQQPPPGSHDRAITRSRAVLADVVRRGEVAGLAVAVAERGRIVWTEGIGHADAARRTPATAATVFGVGSISKAFTLAAALALVDGGKLDLDAPVERYLPDFPHSGHGVTVRRIAAHQSGLADEFAARHYYDTTRFADLESAYRHIRHERLAYPPGTRTEYATGIFTILGRVLERVDAAPYTEIMRRRVFRSAGMTATVPLDPRRTPPGLTVFHVRQGDGGFAPAPRLDPSFKLPGAGYLSTAADVARFGAALLRPGLLSAAARREMFVPVPLADSTPTGYALGFQARREDGRRVLLQPGGGPGITAFLAVYADEDLVVAILSNTSGAALESERRAVGEAFLSRR